MEDARRLVKFCKQENVDTQGAVFNLVDELEVTRDRFFGRQVRRYHVGCSDIVLPLTG